MKGTEMVQKIVVNRCFGGFELSLEAKQYYLGLVGKRAYFYVLTFDDGHNKYFQVTVKNSSATVYTFTKDFGENFTEWPANESGYFDMDLARDDPNLVKTVEALGEKASARGSEIEIVEIPDGVNWVIEEYDGYETVAEKHRSW